LVKPAGVMVEILYLDRSPGTEANTFRWEPVDHDGMPLPNPPAIRLLYRPCVKCLVVVTGEADKAFRGHYDILYKLEDLPRSVRAPPATQQDVLVALQHTSTEHYHATVPFPLSDYELPGMSVYSGPNMGWSASPPYDFVAAAVSPSMADQVPRSVSTPNYAPTPMISPLSSDYFPQPLHLEQPASSMPIQTQQSFHHPISVDRGGPFRHSRWEYENNFAPAPSFQSACQTSIFKK
jgi:ubiquitin thioesterase protein OTUB1